MSKSQNCLPVTHEKGKESEHPEGRGGGKGLEILRISEEPPVPPIYAEYIKLTKEYQKKYGDNTVVLLQVGAFFEVYGFANQNGEIQDSLITEFSQLCNLNVSEKKIVFEGRQVYMAGFRDYTLDK